MIKFIAIFWIVVLFFAIWYIDCRNYDLEMDYYEAWEKDRQFDRAMIIGDREFRGTFQGCEKPKRRGWLRLWG